MIALSSFAAAFILLVLAVYYAPVDGEYVYEQYVRYIDKEYRDANPLDPFVA